MKRVFILGDSYSTFRGEIPEGNAFYYSEKSEEEYKVGSADKTWWKMLLEETSSELVLNESYSGSTICNTTYNGERNCETSFIGRLKRLSDSGFFINHPVDEVWLMGGTNDSWASSPIGELKYSDFTKEDMYSVLPAFCCLIEELKKTGENVNIISIINSELNPLIEEGMTRAAEHYNIKSFVLKDIEKTGGHPTFKGMTEIKNQVSANLKI